MAYLYLHPLPLWLFLLKKKNFVFVWYERRKKKGDRISIGKKKIISVVSLKVVGNEIYSLFEMGCYVLSSGGERMWVADKLLEASGRKLYLDMNCIVINLFVWENREVISLYCFKGKSVEFYVGCCVGRYWEF